LHRLGGDCFNMFQHSVIMVDDNQIIDSVDGKATLTPLPSDQQGWLWSTDQFKLTDTHRNKIVATAMDMVGTPYSHLDIFAIVARRLQLPDDGEIRNYLKATDHMSMAQLIDYCYRLANVQLFSDGRSLGFVTATHLGMLIQHPESVKYGRIRVARKPMPMP
jgi:hypothetical protein